MLEHGYASIILNLIFFSNSLGVMQGEVLNLFYFHFMLMILHSSLYQKLSSGISRHNASFIDVCKLHNVDVWNCI